MPGSVAMSPLPKHAREYLSQDKSRHRSGCRRNRIFGSRPLALLEVEVDSIGSHYFLHLTIHFPYCYSSQTSPIAYWHDYAEFRYMLLSAVMGWFRLTIPPYQLEGSITFWRQDMVVNHGITKLPMQNDLGCREKPRVIGGLGATLRPHAAQALVLGWDITGPISRLWRREERIACPVIYSHNRTRQRAALHKSCGAATLARNLSWSAGLRPRCRLRPLSRERSRGEHRIIAPRRARQNDAACRHHRHSRRAQDSH